MLLVCGIDISIAFFENRMEIPAMKNRMHPPVDRGLGRVIGIFRRENNLVRWSLSRHGPGGLNVRDGHRLGIGLMGQMADGIKNSLLHMLADFVFDERIADPGIGIN